MNSMYTGLQVYIKVTSDASYICSIIWTIRHYLGYQIISSHDIAINKRYCCLINVCQYKECNNTLFNENSMSLRLQ